MVNDVVASPLQHAAFMSHQAGQGGHGGCEEED